MFSNKTLNKRKTKTILTDTGLKLSFLLHNHCHIIILHKYYRMNNAVSIMPKKCSHSHPHHNPQYPQWKTVLINVVTLIFVYYPSCHLIISCSIPNGIAQAQSKHNGPKLDDEFYHHFDLKHKTSQQKLQDNDIFTLTQPQGRSNEEHGQHKDNDNSHNHNSRSGIVTNKDVNHSAGSKNTLTLPSHYQHEPPNHHYLLQRHVVLIRDEQKSDKERNKDGRDENSIKDKSQDIPQKSIGSVAMNCKDEHGNDVSWFIAYKLPQIPESSDPLENAGTKYVYILPGNQSWISSTFPISDNRSILAATMAPMWDPSFNANGNISQIFYNDQPPNLPAVVVNGHSKGIILASPEGGLWLQHSCPHFPNTASSDFPSSYPPGGLINGQMFFCMSVGPLQNVDILGNAFQYVKPVVFNYSIPTTMMTTLPQLLKVATKNATTRTAPWFKTFDLTAGNMTLKVFAKGPKFRKDVYSAWIVPEYDTGLDVQSWLNGMHPLTSNCTVNNETTLNILEKNVAGQKFSYANDHSKWAVSSNGQKPIVCIGDLNRMKPQKSRGGVTVCMSDYTVWSAFKSIIEATQPCNSSLKTFRHSRNVYRY